VRDLKRAERAARDEHIQARRAEGAPIKRIAREIAVSVKTVRRVVRGRAERSRRPSKLEPFRPLIRQRVEEDGLSAVLLLEEIQALGYDGGYTILKDYVRTLRRKPARRAHLRFETEPGEQGQVDLSPYTVLIGEAPTPVVCFSLVLGYSRWQYIRFLAHADAHSVCHCHVLAFEEMGGIPLEILYDRMKQIVLESHRHQVVYHPLFKALREHYGFRAVPLAPGYKEGKGKVENPFRYIEGNFLPRRRYTDLSDLNRQASEWLKKARARCHGTTRERPVDRLDVERPRLLALPPEPFDAAMREERSVGDDFHIPWGTNRYSVPPRLHGQTVVARVLEGWLEVLVGPRDKEECVARHPLRETKHKRYTLPEHEAEFREHSKSRHVLEEQFLRLGPAAQSFVAGLVAERGGAAGYHMSRILALRETIGHERVAEALRQAARYHAFDYNAVARIARGKAPSVRPASLAEPVPTHIAQFLRGAGQHQRPLESYKHRLGRPRFKKPEDNDGER
jgi:transposase